MLRTLSFVIFLVYLAYGQSISAQETSLNVELKQQLDPADVPGRYNDCWGYTAPNGKEYGIVGSSQHIHFYDMTDIDNVTEIQRLTPGGSSTWRDFKTYGQFAYGVTDNNSADEGLVIMNLTDIDNNITFWSDNSDFNDAHNIFVDTLNAKLYAVGTDTRHNGLIIYDLLPHPDTPRLLASVNLNQVGSDGRGYGYVHDLYVRDDIAYCSHEGRGYGIWDVSTPSSPIQLGFLDPPGSGYNHSSWLTEDGNYSFWCEETRGRKIHVADVSDPEAISVELQFSDPLIPADAANLVAHNPFIKDEILYISYYLDGVQIYDVSDPLNPVRVGYYDTNTANTDYSAGTASNWGVYPYFTDNKIIATDRDNGVFFLVFDEQAAFLPVELISWTGQIESGSALLSWVTAQEVNSDYYEIEYSHNNKDFVSLGFVQSKKNTQEVSRYRFIHSDMRTGKNYYRLKMVDQDGSYTYSNLIDLNNLANDIPWFIYPNPSDNEIMVDLPESESDLNESTFVIYDNQGKASLSGHGRAQDQNTLSIEHALAPGIYTLELRLADGQYHRDQIAVY